MVGHEVRKNSLKASSNLPKNPNRDFPLSDVLVVCMVDSPSVRFEFLEYSPTLNVSLNVTER